MNRSLPLRVRRQAPAQRQAPARRQAPAVRQAPAQRRAVTTEEKDSGLGPLAVGGLLAAAAVFTAAGAFAWSRKSEDEKSSANAVNFDVPDEAEGESNVLTVQAASTQELEQYQFTAESAAEENPAFEPSPPQIAAPAPPKIDLPMPEEEFDRLFVEQGQGAINDIKVAQILNDETIKYLKFLNQVNAAGTQEEQAALITKRAPTKRVLYLFDESYPLYNTFYTFWDEVLPPNKDKRRRAFLSIKNIDAARAYLRKLDVGPDLTNVVLCTAVLTFLQKWVSVDSAGKIGNTDCRNLNEVGVYFALTSKTQNVKAQVLNGLKAKIIHHHKPEQIFLVTFKPPNRPLSMLEEIRRGIPLKSLK